MPSIGSRRSVRAALAALLVATTGCSLVSVRGPPPRPLDPRQPVSCTTSRAAPILDTVAGVPLVVLGLGIGINAASSCDPGKGFDCFGHGSGVSTPAFAAAALGAILLVSALNGYVVTGRCNDAIDWRAACLGGDAAACAQLRGDASTEVPSER